MWPAYMLAWALLATPCVSVPPRSIASPIKDDIKSIKSFMENLTGQLQILQEENNAKNSKMDQVEELMFKIENNKLLSDVKEIKEYISEAFQEVILPIRRELEDSVITLKDTNEKMFQKLDVAMSTISRSEELLTTLSKQEPYTEGIFNELAARGMLDLLKEINNKINSNQTDIILTEIRKMALSQSRSVDDSNIDYKIIPSMYCQNATLVSKSGVFGNDYCQVRDDETRWTVIQRRGFDSSINFNRSWQEYQEGFGNLAGDFWSSIEHLHLITTNQTMILMIELEDFEGNTAWAEYDRFVVSDSSDGYRLLLGKYTGNATDSFSSHNNSRFSTYDRKNDNAPECCPCAVSYGGGWWYNSCFETNLNGVYNPSKDAYFEGIIWEKWLGNYSLKHSQMMISPKDYILNVVKSRAIKSKPVPLPNSVPQQEEYYPEYYLENL